VAEIQIYNHWVTSLALYHIGSKPSLAQVHRKMDPKAVKNLSAFPPWAWAMKRTVCLSGQLCFLRAL